MKEGTYFEIFVWWFEGSTTEDGYRNSKLGWRFPALARLSVCFGGSRWFRPLRPVRRY